MATNLLVEASALYRTKKYRQIINLLEPQIVHYRENEEYHYTLGLTYFRIAEYTRADSYLQRTLRLDSGHTEALLVRALLLLRAGNGEQSIASLLAILDVDPKNRRARRVLALLRTTPDSVTSSFYILHRSALDSLVPRRVGTHFPKRAVSVIALCVAIACVGGLYMGIRLSDTVFTRGTRDGVVAIRSARRDRPIVEAVNGHRVIYSDQEIKGLLRDIETNFLDSRDNLVCRDINRILNSNAARTVKAKMRHISGYLATPTYVNFRDNFEWDSVVQEPWSYNGCHALWRGRQPT